MHETSSNALLIHFHSAPYALHNAPFDLGIKRAARLDMPDGKVLDAMVDFSDAMGVDGSTPMEAHTRGRARPSPLVAGRSPRSLANAQATAAVQRWLETPECPRRCVSHSLRQSFLLGAGNFSLTVEAS